MKTLFARHGIPEVIKSDNGPQYSSGDFAEFAKSWGFKHVTSSPLYPKSNGLAERTVRTAKSILTKARRDHQDPHLVLLDQQCWITSKTEYGKKTSVKNAILN